MGRPPGTGKKQTTRSASTKAKKPEPQKELSCRCVRCGREYTKQMGNFRKVRSPMYKANDGYIPICDYCLKELYDHYFEVLGDKEAAIYRLCLKFDVYWSPEVYKMTLNGAIRDNPMSVYISRSNLVQVKYDCFDDTLDAEAVNNGEIELSGRDIRDMNEAGTTEITESDIENWGAGYTKDEYVEMDSHYDMLTQGKRVDDFLKNKYIKDMCVLNTQSKRSLSKGDTKTYSDLLAMYQKIASFAQIKVSEDVDTSNDCLGKWLAAVEEFTPAEYYKDKTKYRDFFGIGEYCERFIYRPLKNWVTGSKDRDKEFNLDGES